VAPWERREALSAWEKALDRAVEDSGPASEEFDVAAPFSRTEGTGLSGNRLVVVHAQAAGLSALGNRRELGVVL